MRPVRAPVRPRARAHAASSRADDDRSVQQPSQPSRAAHPAALVVTTDRAAVDRSYRPLVVVVAVLVAIMLLLVLAMAFLAGMGATIGDGSTPWTLAPLLVVMPCIVLVSIANLALMAHAWGAMRSLDERVVADARGLAVSLPGVRVRMPWQAVQGAILAGSGRRERLTIRIDGSLLEGDLPEAQRRRASKRGSC